MIRNSGQSFFSRIRQRSFQKQVDREIFDRIFPHLRGERDNGYSFANEADMSTESDTLDIHPLLKSIESEIRRMPKAYGASFRYILHRDIRERLGMFQAVGQRRIHPTSIDPRYVATYAT